MRLTTKTGTVSLVTSATRISTKRMHFYDSFTMRKPIRNSTIRSFSTGRASPKSTTKHMMKGSSTEMSGTKIIASNFSKLPMNRSSTKTPASIHLNILSTTHLSSFSLSLSTDPVRAHKLLDGLSTRSAASALASPMMTTTKSPSGLGSRLAILRRLRGIWRVLFGL